MDAFIVSESSSDEESSSDNELSLMSTLTPTPTPTPTKSLKQIMSEQLINKQNKEKRQKQPTNQLPKQPTKQLPKQPTKQQVKKENIEKKRLVSISRLYQTPNRSVFKPIKKYVKQLPPRPLTKRSPICCIIGHVNSGKTSLLDYIRNTSIQSNEAGGITQSIGTTFIPITKIISLTNTLNNDIFKNKLKFKLPGLLIIDTPGHSEFNNLRKRGTTMSDIVILNLNITKGIETETIKSIKLLNTYKVPFIIVINQIDKTYEWAPTQHAHFRKTYDQQNPETKNHFTNMLNTIQDQFLKHDIHTSLYHKNKNPTRVYSIVPTSAKTGEGIPDLMTLISLLTQNKLKKRLALSTTTNAFKATILEVQNTPGHGTTINIILTNGQIAKNDKLVICGENGPIITKVRALLVPNNMKSNIFTEHKQVFASRGIKISAKNLTSAIPGTKILLHDPTKITEQLETVQQSLTNLKLNFKTNSQGVFINTSSLGSLEVIIHQLQQKNILVSNFHLGPITHHDLKLISATPNATPGYNTILAFNIVPTKEIQKLADTLKIKIIHHDILYSLITLLDTHLLESLQQKTNSKTECMYPVKLKILQSFNNKNPIILGVKIIQGTLHLNTPLVAMINDKKYTAVGTVRSIQHKHKSINVANISKEVAIKLDCDNTFNKDFNKTHTLCTALTTRDHIEILKRTHPEELKKNKKMRECLFSLMNYFKIKKRG